MPQNFDEVLQALEAIVEESIERKDYLAIFAHVYHQVTQRIKEGVEANDFEDNERMERFDVVFANRYLRAYRSFRAQQPHSQSWQVPFAAASTRLTILQHLMMGMNAHISFDLGVAAAEVASGPLSDDLRVDFLKVNDILKSMINDTQLMISKASPLFFVIDWIGGRSDEKIINFSLRSSRELAWQVAKTLTSLEGDLREAAIVKFDEQVAQLNRLILEPPGRLLSFGLRVIRTFEPKDSAVIIERLRGAQA